MKDGERLLHGPQPRGELGFSDDTHVLNYSLRQRPSGSSQAPFTHSKQLHDGLVRGPHGGDMAKASPACPPAWIILCKANPRSSLRRHQALPEPDFRSQAEVFWRQRLASVESNGSFLSGVKSGLFCWSLTGEGSRSRRIRFQTHAVSATSKGGQY